MNENFKTEIYHLSPPRFEAAGSFAGAGMTDAAIAAAVRLQSGAAALKEQVEADREIIARVGLAVGNLSARVAAMRATAETFLAAVQEELRKD
jgi:hypothetical protein